MSRESVIDVRESHQGIEGPYLVVSSSSEGTNAVRVIDAAIFVGNDADVTTAIELMMVAIVRFKVKGITGVARRICQSRGIPVPDSVVTVPPPA